MCLRGCLAVLALDWRAAAVAELTKECPQQPSRVVPHRSQDDGYELEGHSADQKKAAGESRSGEAGRRSSGTAPKRSSEGSPLGRSSCSARASSWRAGFCCDRCDLLEGDEACWRQLHSACGAGCSPIDRMRSCRRSRAYARASAGLASDTPPQGSLPSPSRISAVCPLVLLPHGPGNWSRQEGLSIDQPVLMAIGWSPAQRFGLHRSPIKSRGS